MTKEKINITTHDGKMAGIHSISTSVLLNHNCQRNATIRGSICKHCYAGTLCQMRKGLSAALERNTRILTTRILPFDELPDTTGDEIFRFESFGDLNNEIQLQNYMNIVAKNPKTRFSLYTKMYGIVLRYFSSHVAPPNFTLVVSSLMVNKPLNLAPLYATGAFNAGQLKNFTVYDKKYLKEHGGDCINCGSRSCAGCRLCYDKNSVVQIGEILKSEQAEVEERLRWQDPDYAQKTGKTIETIINSWRI